jgi:hypothetical protein
MPSFLNVEPVVVRKYSSKFDNNVTKLRLTSSLKKKTPILNNENGRQNIF